MDIKEIKNEYLPVRQLDKDEKGTVEIVRSGDRQYILRTMNGNISSYPALRNIASPYLPRIEYAAFDGEKTVVLEEYIPGGKDISSLTNEKEIVAAFCELCEVLGVLHSRGIVHRDIKPSNILIAPDGHIRLIDFDASRRYDDSKDSDTRYLGTKGYAPPEQFGYSQTSAASDIYSLGVTLKTVLGDKAEKGKFRRIIRKCTEFDPKNRYQSAAGVKRALKSGKSAAFLPSALSAAAIFIFALCIFGDIYGKEAENTAFSDISSAETSSAAAERVSAETASSTTGTTASLTAAKTETADITLTEATTTAPVTEATTAVPETEVTSAESLTSEETSAVSTASSTQTAKATTTAPKTTAAPKTTTTAVKTTTAPKTEASSTAETTSMTTSPTGMSAGVTVKKLLTRITDGAKTPAFTRQEFSYGQYCDVLNEPFEFIPDEAVVGTWNELNYTSNGTILYEKMNYNLQKKSNYDTFPKRLIFNEDGTCYHETYTNYGGNLKFSYSSILLNWTYGLIETPAVEDYYFYEKYYLYRDESGEEYLFVEHKNGDYMNSQNPEAGLHYYIYERYKGH